MLNSKYGGPQEWAQAFKSHVVYIDIGSDKQQKYWVSRMGQTLKKNFKRICTYKKWVRKFLPAPP